MKLPSDTGKFSARFKYVEFGYATTNKTTNKPMLRRILNEDGTPTLYTWDEVAVEAAKHDNTGVYTSVYQYDSKDFNGAAYLSSLYFDLDSDNAEESHRDTLKLYAYLQDHIPIEAIEVYFSGSKGFHIECEALCLNISSSDSLSGIFSYIAHDLQEKLGLTTLDFKVYDIRRMWRIPDSKHQSTGLHKIMVNDTLTDLSAVKEYAKHPFYYTPPEQTFDYEANRWYRDYVIDYEASLVPKRPTSDVIARFLEQGTDSIKHIDAKQQVFDKFRLLKNCPAIGQLEEKAIKDKHLDHYERLFLCSLLTYNNQAIQYLHEILSHCADYRFEVSDAHIQDWIKRREKGIGGRPFTCNKARQIGIMCSGCDKLEPKKRIEQIDEGKYIETEGYSSPSPIRFAYSTNKNFGVW